MAVEQESVGLRRWRRKVVEKERRKERK